MKKYILSMALLVATSVVAGDKQPYHIEFSSGLAVFEDSSHLEDGAIHGMSATFYEKEYYHYGLQIGYEYLPSIAYDTIVLDSDINRYYLNMIVDGEEDLSVTPYLLIGGGYEHLSNIYESYPDTKNQAFVNAGIGFRYRLNDYFNITFETKAIGKFDSKSVDYVTKMGLDIMFGGKWSKAPKVIEGLGEERVEDKDKKVISQSPKPALPLIMKSKEKKKKKWITPEVVEEMFSEKKEIPKVVKKEMQTSTMEAELRALKEQMAKNEALWAAKLSSLETALAKKLKERESTDVYKTFHRLEKEAEAGHLKKIAKTKAKIKKVKASIKALDKSKRVSKLKHAKSVVKPQLSKREKERLALKKRKKERAAAFARKKAMAAKLKAQKLAALKAEEKRVALKMAKEREAERREKEKKRLEEEVAASKAQQEKTDILHIANGMAVFAD
jgi:hypothetical protein